MTSAPRTILVISHGHPSIRPGGGENAAFSLHQELRRCEGVRSLFLAAAPASHFNKDQDLICFDVESESWLLKATNDWWTFQSACSLFRGDQLYELIQRLQPDVVSVHQIMHVGIDVILKLREWCPKARIIYTLHEFLLICPSNGQLRNSEGVHCGGPVSTGCPQCLPSMTSDQHLLRQLRIQMLLEVIDHFISPSFVVRDRFVARGIKEDQISVVPNLLPEQLRSLSTTSSGQVENLNTVFGFFGNCTEPKGLDLILEALMEVVRLQPEAKLVVHGPVHAVLEQGMTRNDSYGLKLSRLLVCLGNHVILSGPYEQQELPMLMKDVGWVVMASRWLENAPVVIQEALACRRPLLVPAFGGMAEHVRNGFDGLHFAPESVDSLRDVMLQVCRYPEIWLDLRSTLAEPLSAENALQKHLELFEFRT